jgi:hypothetical protein
MKTSKTGVLVVALLLLGLSLSSCAPLRTGYLRDYDKLQKGKYLESYWSNTALIEKKKYSLIGVEAINVDRITNQTGVTTEDCRTWLQNALIRATSTLRRQFVFWTVKDQEKAQTKLEIAITEMTPGSAGGRMFAGEFGLGHAWVQVEGRLVDIESNEEVVVFSERRRHSGAIGFRDLGGDAGPALVRELLEGIAADSVKELRETFGF